MPKIRWTGNTKVHNKAIGLPGPEVAWAARGDELEVSAATLKAIQDRYDPSAYEVVEEPKKAAASAKKEK